MGGERSLQGIVFVITNFARNIDEAFAHFDACCASACRIFTCPPPMISALTPSKRLWPGTHPPADKSVRRPSTLRFWPFMIG